MPGIPEPLTPEDLDLRVCRWMKLDVNALIQSDFWHLSSDREFRAALALWCACWHQVPAASLPDDDHILAGLAGFRGDVEAWRAVRKGALHNFVLCSDGRLYHRVIAKLAIEAGAELDAARRRREDAAERQRKRRERQAEERLAREEGRASSNRASRTSHEHVTRDVTHTSRVTNAHVTRDVTVTNADVTRDVTVTSRGRHGDHACDDTRTSEIRHANISTERSGAERTLEGPLRSAERTFKSSAHDDWCVRRLKRGERPPIASWDDAYGWELVRAGRITDEDLRKAGCVARPEVERPTATHPPDRATAPERQLEAVG